MTDVDIMYASEVEEFFYEENDLPVSEGQIIGVEVSHKDSVELVLFEDIYWRANND
tara:strand:- start:1093 stop:1260 length:168 start_codon:yes stop_codon:yes gene_type:complete